MAKILSVFLILAVTSAYSQTKKSDNPKKTKKVEKSSSLQRKLGIGYWSNSNLSIRYWIKSDLAIDGGLGFSTGGNSSFNFTCGVPIVLKSYSALLLQIRPGFELTTTTNVGTTIDIEGRVLAEYFLPGTNRHLSISAGIGMGLRINTPTGQSTTVSFISMANQLAVLAAHFYF